MKLLTNLCALFLAILVNIKLLREKKFVQEAAFAWVDMWSRNRIAV